jgi:hypothetical protein
VELDDIRAEEAEIAPQQSATPAQRHEMEIPPEILQTIDFVNVCSRPKISGTMFPASSIAAFAP